MAKKLWHCFEVPFFWLTFGVFGYRWGRKIWRIERRLLKFGAVGGAVLVVGTAVLLVLVEVFDLEPTKANLVELGVTLLLNFWLNSLWTWRSSPAKNWGELRIRLVKFTLSRLFVAGGEQLLFVQLLDLGASYLPANLFCVGLGTVANFATSFVWIFIRRSPKDET